MTLRKPLLVVLILYIALTIYTVAGIWFDIRYQPFFTPMLTVLAFVFALLHGWQYLGWKRTLLLLGLTFGVSLLFESIGVATGLVYGPYHYTDKLGTKFLGLVPYLIPVAWFMMTYPSYLIARRIVRARRNVWAWRLAVAAVGGVIMTAWDLAMDPVMTAAEHWVWEAKGAYFGIPLQNYWGWWLTIFVTFALFGALGKMTPAEQLKPSLDGTFERLPVLSYAVTGLSSILVDLQVGLSGPGLVGLFAMLPWVLMGWWAKD
jgi:uncharacterized membrane protein